MHTFMNKAKENLKAAEVCFEHGLYNACANRVYYAALQGAYAALLHAGIKRDKIDHKKVQADFNGELIRRRKIYPSKFRSCLSDMQTARNVADYTQDAIGKKVARRWVKTTSNLLEVIEKEIGK